MVEFPAFYDNLEEFENYVKVLNKNIFGKVFNGAFAKEFHEIADVLKNVDTKI